MRLLSAINFLLYPVIRLDLLTKENARSLLASALCYSPERILLEKFAITHTIAQLRVAAKVTKCNGNGI